MKKKYSFRNIALFMISPIVVGVTILTVPKTVPDNIHKQIENTMNASMMSIEDKLPSLDVANAWLNTTPLTTTSLKGKVILVEFWTYSCINWMRTLPYVRAWSEKYKNNGLVVIGIHTPEFPFEKNIQNVQQALQDMNIKFPVAIDNNYALWRAFENQYWPAIYIIDGNGIIRHHQFGEGQYDLSEKMIQQLLIENGAKNVSEDLISVYGEGLEAAPDWSNIVSGENYLGNDRTVNFTSPGFPALNKSKEYHLPMRLKLNEWALSGEWNVMSGSISSSKTNARIVYRFHARDLHIVMGPLEPGRSIRFRVTIDGKVPAKDHGTDVDEEGNGIVTMQRLYQIIRQTDMVTDHEFEIEFLDSGVEAFSFTFG